MRYHSTKMLTRLNISSEELEKLNYERYHYPCPIVQKRLHAIYIKAVTNMSNEQVAVVSGAHRNSVCEWIRIWETGGFAALLEINRVNNKSLLEDHAPNIIEQFKAQPPHNIAESIAKIKELTGIERSHTAVRSFMKRHGFRYLKTGHIPAKVNNTQQHDWVEQTLKPVIAAAQKDQLHLLSMDAAHFILQPFLCCLWCASRVFVKASAGRNRINVLGAINAITKEVTTYSNTTYIDATTIVGFLKQIRERYNDKKPIAIVLDNARYQHCFEVKAIAAGLGIHLLFLPPYSPNLNIIERLWKFTKKKILYAQYYDCPNSFHSAINSFFQNINHTHNIELQKLMTLNFQFFHKNTAHSYAA